MIMGRMAFAVTVVSSLVLLGGLTAGVVSAGDQAADITPRQGIATQTTESDRAALVALYNATDGPNWERNTYWLSDVPIGRWYGVGTDDSGRVVALDLPHNQLSGELPGELGNLTNLTFLQFIGNQLSGEIPEELGNLTNLRYMLLYGNQLSGEIPSELGSLIDLTELGLGSNELSGEIPAELGRLTNLESLALADNQLSGGIPEELGNLTNLYSLYLGGNRLTGCIPWGLREIEGHDLYELGLPFCVSMYATMNTETPVRLDSAIPVTVTFSKPVFGFTIDDINVANGDVSKFTGSGAVYTFNVTPKAIGEVTVNIAAGVVTDADGYGNKTPWTVSLGIPYDDDGNASISKDEAITAVIDYFNGRITKEQAIAVIILYFNG